MFFSTVQQKASNAVTAVSGAARNARNAVSGAVTGKPPLPNEQKKKEGNTPVGDVVELVGAVEEEVPAAAAVVGGSRKKSKKAKKAKKSKKTKRNRRY